MLLSDFELNQFINKPTNILNNSSSCIDLIFTSQRNLVTESDVCSSRHLNCHYQIAYISVNLKVIYFPSPFPLREGHVTTN